MTDQPVQVHVYDDRADIEYGDGSVVAVKDVRFFTARDQLVRDLAEIMAGLQVPYSIGKQVLGAAAEPWKRVWDRLGMFGWVNADEIAEKLREALK